MTILRSTNCIITYDKAYNDVNANTFRIRAIKKGEGGGDVIASDREKRDVKEIFDKRGGGAIILILPRFD